MPWIEWYNSLAKPGWTPAPATIGLIWQILYPIIVVSFGFVFVQAIRKKLPWLVALPFAINLVANLIFTPIQFGMRNLPLAAVDILIVWSTIIWMIVVIWLKGDTAFNWEAQRGHSIILTAAAILVCSFSSCHNPLHGVVG